MKTLLIGSLAALALTLTACDSSPEVQDPTTGEKIDAEAANKAGKPPLVPVAPARVYDGDGYGVEADEFWEVHLKLDSGEVVTCIYNTYQGEISTCDWDHPLTEAPAR